MRDLRYLINKNKTLHGQNIFSSNLQILQIAAKVARVMDIFLTTDGGLLYCDCSVVWVQQNWDHTKLVTTCLVTVTDVSKLAIIC